MPDVTVIPSSSPLVLLEHYEEQTAVITNKSEKSVVALRVVWIHFDANKRRRVRKLASDSFGHPMKSPVLTPHARLFLTPREMIWEQSVGTGLVTARPRLVPDPVEANGTMSVHVDVILFEDGEVCGHDRYRLLEELEARRASAQRLAPVVRAAIARGDSPNRILQSFSGRIYSRTDFKAQWRQRLADEYLRAEYLRADLSSPESLNRWLENLETMPELPKFYGQIEAF